MTDRNLCGIFTRVKRGDKFESIAFSDLSEQEMLDFLKGTDEEYLKLMCIMLAQTLKGIGNTFDIIKD